MIYGLYRDYMGMSGFVVQGESSQGLGFNVWGLVYCIACGVWSGCSTHRWFSWDSCRV